MKTRTTLFLILVSFIGLQAQTVITGGDVFGEWKTEDSPFLIEGDIYLPPDERLTIRPGVEVIFQDYYSFDIAGRIEILGTPTDSIHFTVQDTSGYYLGDHAGWNGLVFNGMFSSLEEYSVIEYCIIEYSKISGITGIYYPKLKISYSNIRFNQTAGITLYEFSDIEINGILVHHNMGGGITCNNSAPTVDDFTIMNNLGSGLAIYGYSMSGMIPAFSYGKIINNNSTSNGGGLCMWDAGIYAENIEIISNSATNGGGIYCDMSSGVFTNVIISENVAENGGGIQSEFFTNITFDHVLVADNHANASGGGAYIYESNVEFINATITNNTAAQGGGLYYNLFSFYENEVVNSIVWNNVPDEIYSAFESPEISYSNILGGIEGNGNIDEDPLFVDPTNKDYRLQWLNFPNENDGKSPCIDAGDPTSIFDPDGTINDMGVYFFDQGIFTTIAEKTPVKEIIIYPNPVVNEVHIKGTENITKIQVINLLGQVVVEQFTNGLHTEIVDLSGINPGVHIINLYNIQGSVVTKKIIKK